MGEYLPQPSDLIPLLPGAGVGVVLFIMAGLLHGEKARGAAALIAGLALAAVHVTTYWNVHGAPAFPPVQTTERMVYAIPLFCLGGVLAWRLEKQRAVRFLVRCLLAAGLVCYLLKPYSAFLDSPAGFYVQPLQALYLTAAMVLVWLGAERMARDHKGPALPISFALVLGLGGQIFVLYGAALLAQLAGAAAMALGVSGFFARWLPERVFPVVAAGGLIGVMAGIGLDGYYFISETPPAIALLIPLAAPLLLYSSKLKRVQDMKPLPRFILQMFLVAIPLGIAFWIAVEGVPVDPYGDLYK